MQMQEGIAPIAIARMIADPLGTGGAMGIAARVRASMNRRLGGRFSGLVLRIPRQGSILLDPGAIASCMGHVNRTEPPTNLERSRNWKK